MVPEINWRASLTDVETEQLIALLAAARATDGRPSFSPSEGLPGDYRTPEYGLAKDGAELVGVVARNTGGDSFGRQIAELIVRPDRRGQGVGAALVEALLDRVGPAAGDAETLRLWSHGDHPAAAKLAARFGLRRVREMRRMRLTFADLPNGLPEQRSLPDGVRLRTFRIGADEQALVEVNHRAFAWHPEQGALSVADVEADEAQSWFDPNGLFLAVREDDDTLLGFHWTKIHEELDGAGAPMGEVYVVGVDPNASGHGLGKTLTLAGLRYLAGRGCRQVMLYVESDNAPAIAVYSRLGFSNWDADVQYAY
ncbi:MAG TPA: mycothiol synthase [Pseudonocardiaceae bacterium]|nr:mycothiol synthase [Pseudonocardiaceae bacterium]